MPWTLKLLKIDWKSIGRIKIYDYKATIDISVTRKANELSTGSYQETEVITHDIQTIQVTPYNKNFQNAEKSQEAERQIFPTNEVAWKTTIKPIDVKGFKKSRGSTISRSALSRPADSTDVNQERHSRASRSASPRPANSIDVNHSRGSASSRSTASKPADSIDVNQDRSSVSTRIAAPVGHQCHPQQR